MYKQNLGIENRLREIANEDYEYRELWSTWNLNKQTLEPVLNAIIKDYPHYSLHDHSHSESILLNIERLLGNDNIERLSPSDLWLLLHVAYLHDFGMVILDSDVHEIWSSLEFQDFLREQSKSQDEDLKKASNTILGVDNLEEKYSNTWPLEVKCAITILISTYCRSQHAKFSSKYILDIDNLWGIDLGHNGLIKKRFITLLAEISIMHTKGFDEIFRLHKESNGIKNDYIHPRLIACLLRLGDVLDLDNSRFNRYGEKIFGQLPDNSKVHFEKHEATKHVLINDEVIEVEADCPTDEIYRETRRWFDSLKSEMDNIHLNWNDIAPRGFNYPPKLVPYKILRNGIEDSNELSNLKFTIAQSKAFEILEGSSIYKDKFSCLREIVQNAEDATKIQMWRDIKSGMYNIPSSKIISGNLLPNDIPDWVYQIYTVEVSVEKNENNNAVVSVTDRGTGISLETLKSICNVGQSYFQKQERKKEIDEMPVWLRPTANFGIGLQSCFMVTDKITIYTNSNDDGAYKLTFKSGKQDGYVNIEIVEEHYQRGSTVVIEITGDLNFRYEMFGFTARKLEKVEPFTSNCIVIYKIIESIFKECDSSFFDINVVSNSENFSDKIDSHISIDNIFPNEPFDNSCFYAFQKENRRMIYWYNDNLYKILLRKDTNGEINVKFKGKVISKTPIAQYKYPAFRIDVDIYGVSTKEALSLNREELSRSVSLKIINDIDYLINHYYKYLFNNEELIKDDQILADVLLLTSWYRCKETYPKKFIDYVSEDKNIRVIKYDESNKSYIASTCSLRDIANEFPNIPYVDSDLYPDRRMGEYNLTESELIQSLNECVGDSPVVNLLLIDNNLRKFLSLSFSNKTYIKSDKRVTICRVNISDELYVPDNYTRETLIKDLVYNNKKSNLVSGYFINRRSIPAFKEFEKLAVDLSYINFIGYHQYEKWNIISPITLENSLKIKSYPKNVFVDYIINQPLFNNLVQYVEEHGKIKSTKEIIIEEYKRLIGDYYDVAESRE